MMTEINKKPEILAPVGDMTRLTYAIKYGADAVYLAYREYGMRAAAGNFSLEEIKEAVKICHAENVKVYVTLNTFPTVSEMEKLPEFLKEMSKISPDAFIVADIGVMSLVKQYAPNIEIHVSTQANVTNAVTALMYASLGAKRVVLARESSL